MDTADSSTPPAPSSDQTTPIPQELEHINQEMYKKNLELNIRNKTLALLGKIDEIILGDVTDPKQIAQQVANVIATDGGMEAVVVLLWDKQKNVLTRLAISQTEKIQELEKTLGRNFAGIETSFREVDNIIVKTITGHVMQTTHTLYDVLRPHFTVEESQKIQESLGITTSLIYPLVARNEVLGALVISLNERKEELSQFKKDLIIRLPGVISISLDNALLYQEIRKANEQLQAVDKMKDQFISFAAHELRTPMTAIKSYLLMVMDPKFSPDEAMKQTYLNRMLHSTDRLIALVNDMLDVSRIESGRLQLAPALFSLGELTHEVQDELAAKIVERKQTMTIVEADNTQVFADKDKIHEVLLNLIGNAIKYSSDGATISVTFTQKDGLLVTAIKDTGRGIKAEDLNKLFQKFARLDNTIVNTGETSGSGLGLYICRQLVSLSGGTIWVESGGEGKGTTFSFSLPIQQSVPKPSQPQVASATG